MKYAKMKIKDAFVVDLSPIGDSRGFLRVFCQKEFIQNGLDPRVMQINNSYNKDKGTLRGLHYQLPPFQGTSWYVSFEVLYGMLS